MIMRDFDKKIYITLAVHLCIIPDLLIIFYLKKANIFRFFDGYPNNTKETLIFLILIGKYFFYYKKFELYRNEK